MARRAAQRHDASKGDAAENGGGEMPLVEGSNDLVDVVVEASLLDESTAGGRLVAQRERDDTAESGQRVDSPAHVLPSALQPRDENQRKAAAPLDSRRIGSWQVALRHG